MVSKHSEIWSGWFIPGPDPDFLPIPDPGSRGQKGPGSRIRNIGKWKIGPFNQATLWSVDLLPLTCWPETVGGLAYRERGERGRGHTGVPPLLTQGNLQAVQQVMGSSKKYCLKRQCHEIFILKPKHFNQNFLFMRWWFSRSFNSSSLPFTVINLLFASLKLLTNFENAYWNPPQDSLLCDWSMFSSAELSVYRMQGKCARINLSQAASGMTLQHHKRLPVSICSTKIAAFRVFAEGYWKFFLLVPLNFEFDFFIN